ncbi:phage baseplate protein [Paraburkholderia sp. UCT31]|uniref:phage baseplate protein n=1 Tax=Paraburkholderia sp. UCT31 TaxID=2615209 RepID=UPI001655C601|nr:phage baseplate protein [Paraburkholderia sp. UCT31]MBC8737674.1 phage baseplate protein [Paraburkholderia sp. UCT31]
MLIDAWDRGHMLPADAWALWLLGKALAQEGRSADDLCYWPVGVRDRELLRLREAQFGARLEGLAGCPRCGADAEFELPADALIAAPSGIGAAQFDIEGLRVECRPVNTDDLLAIDAGADVESVADALFDRCVVVTGQDGVRLCAGSVPSAVRVAVNDYLERADPQADLRLHIQCPACGHEWQAGFDIVSFLWKEVSDRVRRLLGEVHELASAYGWSEAEILALRPSRRQYYLGMLTS